MSAGICGKRLGLEEIFGSPSAAPAKKLRRCASPIRSATDFGFGSEDKLSILIRMFPSMDPEVVETVLKTHDNKIDDAIKSLHALCLGDDSARNESAILNSLIQSNDTGGEGCIINAQTPEQKVEGIQNDGLSPDPRIPQNGSSWVDIFVQEMRNASNWDDVRIRTIKALEAFQRSLLDQSTTSKEQEIATLKEQLQCVLRDNQILKRAVSLQHQKNLENEEKLKEVDQLKHIIGQYQEQVRTLEMNNYSLQVHLQRAQEGGSIPGRFHPDVF